MSEETAQSIPEEAYETLSQRSSHGDAVENHKHIAALWSAYLDTDVSAMDAAHCMMLVKMSRAKAGEPVRDHFVDESGYSGIAYAAVEAEDE